MVSLCSPDRSEICLSPKCWDYSCILPHPVSAGYFKNILDDCIQILLRFLNLPANTGILLCNLTIGILCFLLLVVLTTSAEKIVTGKRICYALKYTVKDSKAEEY
jgi:hypothetical protein